jgi:hypothetical protein
MLTLVAGMVLSCMVRIDVPGADITKLKNVPTKVIYVFDDGKKALLEYNFKSMKTIEYVGRGSDKNVLDVEDTENITGRYMDCKEIR